MARALALGFLVGFPIAASPGPIFFLFLRRSLSHGWRNGVASGLGVATGDAIYAALAAFGVAAITNVLLGQRRWIGLAGGVTIALIGLRTLLSGGPHPDSPRPGEANRRGQLAGACGSMVALTLSNPATILSFIAVFAGLGLRVGAGWKPAIALVAGVMLGSAVWWMAMTAIISILGEHLKPAITRGIGFASGLALASFGVLISLQSL